MRSDRTLTAVTPYGRLAGSSRVRVYEWVDHTGISARVYPFLDAANAQPASVARHPSELFKSYERLRRFPSVDSLLVHRGSTPFRAGRMDLRLIAKSDFAVFDLDDALQWDRRGALRTLMSPTSQIPRVMAAVDRVVVGNSVLADYANRLARDVVIIPSCVEPSHYQVKSSYQISSPPRIGWIGSFSSEAYLKLISEPLLSVHRESGARLELLGADEGHLGDLEVMVDRRRWSEASASTVMASWDIGIMPVPDSLYARGKCAYKLLQYGAAGLPGVASPVGANKALVAAGTSIPARGPDDWRDALMDLIRAKPSARERLGRTAVEVVRAGYSFAAWRDQWLSAVRMSTADVAKPQ